MFSKRRIAQLSFFFLRRSFFVGGFCSGVCVKRRAANTAAPTTRMRWTGQIFCLLAYDACAAPHLVPAFTPEIFSGIGPVGSRIQLQQRNCSRFSRDFLRRSTFSSSQRTESRSSGSRSGTQDLIYRSATNRRPSGVIEPYAAKFSSCAARA